MGQRSLFARLVAVIDQRKHASPDTSYVASLLSGGTERISGKVLEEADEFCRAVEGKDRLAVVHEAADLAFHVLILLRVRDVSWKAVEAELERRFGTSGLAEKASRQGARPT